MIKIKINKKAVIITTITFLVLMVIAVFWLFPVREVNEYTTVKVEKTDLVQTVSEVGSVKSAKEIELSFGQGGKVDKLHVETGDKVKKDQLLAELDYDHLLIQRSEAESNLEAALANLRKTRAGATREEIAVAEAEVEAARKNYYSAQDTLEKTEENVQESIAQAEKSLSDLRSNDPDNVTGKEQAVISALKNLNNTKDTYKNSIENKESILVTTIDSKLSAANTALDDIDSIINNDDIIDSLGSKNNSYLLGTEDAYDEAKSVLGQANTSLALAQSITLETRVDEAADDCLEALDKTFDALNICFDLLEYSSLSQTNEETYKATINTEITNISSGISAVETAIQNLDDARLAYETNVSSAQESLDQAEVALEDAIIAAENSLATAKKSGNKEIAAAESSVTSAKESWEVAKSRLSQLRAPARREDIDLYSSKVKQARAALDLIDRNIEDSKIRSPIDGKVVDIEYEPGEQVDRSLPAISVLAENELEIEVDISESDIAKVSVGDQASITLDAFGEDEIFKGAVEFIEPAETVIQDVIYYKVKVIFDEEPAKLEKVKSGMTANVDVTTNIKKNVLVVPARAVIEKNDKKYIKVWESGHAKEHEVEVGIRGDGGLVEVFNHVKPGNEVVTYTKKDKKRVFRFQ